jgi:hypothetical protein
MIPDTNINKKVEEKEGEKNEAEANLCGIEKKLKEKCE